jgi:Ser/Thr protein kinase RdoA (MazF antagonist)
MDAAALPFDALDPDHVLDAVDAAGLRSDGRLLALNSYENRVYQVGLEDGATAVSHVVAKFYRPQRWSDAQILEEHAFLAELAAAEVPAVPPLTFDGRTLLHRGAYRYALFPRRGGRAPDLSRDEHLEWLGRFIARIHAVGRRARFAHRLRFEPAKRAQEAIVAVEALAPLPQYLRAAWGLAARELAAGAAEAFSAAGTLDHLRLHGDCHPGNVLWTDAGPHFVDFDDCFSGPPIVDLWMLLSGPRAEMEHQLRVVLGGYDEFGEFDRSTLGLIEPLRALRMLHYAGWIAQRWTDPAFPLAFPWFPSTRWWEEQVDTFREQREKLDAPTLVPERA